MAHAANGILDYVEGAWDLVRSTDPVFRGRNGLIIMADELFVQLRNVQRRGKNNDEQISPNKESAGSEQEDIRAFL